MLVRAVYSVLVVNKELTDYRIPLPHLDNIFRNDRFCFFASGGLDTPSPFVYFEKEGLQHGRVSRARKVDDRTRADGLALHALQLFLALVM